MQPAAFSQFHAVRENAVFLEIGGSGGLGSINYEHTFRRNHLMQLAWRAGFSLAPIDKNNGVGLVFPVMLDFTLGSGVHKLDAGLGQGLTFTTKGNWFVITTAAIGYRYQPVSKRFFLRLNYTPLISYLVDFQVQHWAGLSIGLNFTQRPK